MENELKQKIVLLKTLLEKRGNKSFLFFENQLSSLDKGLIADVVKCILSSYAIVQYADFNYQEESLFDSIWEIANKTANSSN